MGMQSRLAHIIRYQLGLPEQPSKASGAGATTRISFWPTAILGIREVSLVFRVFRHSTDPVHAYSARWCACICVLRMELGAIVDCLNVMHANDDAWFDSTPFRPNALYRVQACFHALFMTTVMSARFDPSRTVTVFRKPNAEHSYTISVAFVMADNGYEQVKPWAHSKSKAVVDGCRRWPPSLRKGVLPGDRRPSEASFPPSWGASETLQHRSSCCSL